MFDFFVHNFSLCGYDSYVCFIDISYRMHIFRAGGKFRSDRRKIEGRLKYSFAYVSALSGGIFVKIHIQNTTDIP